MEESSKKTKRTSRKPKVDKERVRISILKPLILLIGRWKFESKKEGGDLVVKAYFVRKQLTWEVLQNGYWKKIEIDWSNIVGIKTSLKENEPAILEIEQSRPPKFYDERKNVEPRSHYKWDEGSDFTEGEASKCRRHLVMFPPGVLNKEFERLMNSDERLCELNQKPYPSFQNPYFQYPKSFRSLTQIQPSLNQTLQLHGNQSPSRPVVPLSSHSILLASSFESVTTNLYHQPSSSVGPHIGFSNDTPMNMEAPQLSNTYLCNGPTDFNRVSNDGCFSNRPIYPNEFSSDLLNGSTYSNGVSNDYSSNSQRALNGQYLENDSTYFNRVSNSYFSNWPTDPYGVWLPPRLESEEQDKRSQV